jgi:phosphoribosyl 1,2-cyclic phosphodiesterase
MSLKFCSLASGSSGNCQYIATGSTRILLDAGLSGKYIKTAVESISEDMTNIGGILVTHEHSDHIQGVGVLMRRYGLKVYANLNTWNAMLPKIGKVDPMHIRVIENDVPFVIGDLEIKSISISHDAVDPVAYKFTDGKSHLAVATDLGTMTDAILEELLGVDFLMLESNHDVEMLKMGTYPYYLKRRILSELGHLSNDNAGEISALAVKGGRVQSILLGHLSKENNFPELAYETVSGILRERGIGVGTDVCLDLSFRDKVGRVYSIDR